jgi:hypothetical protein
VGAFQSVCNESIYCGCNINQYKHLYQGRTLPASENCRMYRTVVNQNEIELLTITLNCIANWLLSAYNLTTTQTSGKFATLLKMVKICMFFSLIEFGLRELVGNKQKSLKIGLE